MLIHLNKALYNLWIKEVLKITINLHSQSVIAYCTLESQE